MQLSGKANAALLALATLTASIALSGNAHAQRFNPGSLTYLGQATFPGSAPVTVEGTTVGGLSGIDYDAANNRYFLNSDAPTNPRLYTATLDIDGGLFNNEDVTFTDAVLLNGLTPNTFDLEGIRYLPGSNSVLIPDEGNTLVSIAPSVREFDVTTGNQIRQITAPGKFNPTATNGVYFNLAFESVSLSGNGGTILTGTENALRQDAGNPAQQDLSLAPRLARLLAFDAATGAPGAEYAYPVDAVTELPTTGNFAVQGLVEILSLGGDDYLSIERSFTVGGTGTGYSINLYQFSLAGATDISGIDPLAGDFTAIQKELLLDLSTLGIPLDNIEGVTLGPSLPGGRRTLVLVSDDNFSAAQFTQFIVLAEAPEPGTAGLALLGLAGLGVLGIARRKR